MRASLCAKLGAVVPHSAMNGEQIIKSSQTAAPWLEPGGLAAELRAVVARLPWKPYMLAVMVGWLLLFQLLGNSTFGYYDSNSLFAWLNNAYQNSEDDQHGYLMPVVVIILLWVRRREILEHGLAPYWPAILVVCAGLSLHIFGYVVQQARFSFLGFALGGYGITGLFWGRQWMRWALFPFGFLFFCIPLGSSSEFITFPLRMLTTKLSVGFCNFFLGMDVIRDGSRIFSRDLLFQFDVAPACSGIRSLFSLLAIGAVYSSLKFDQWWKVLLMTAITIPLAVLGNTVRIIVVVIVGEVVSANAGARIEQNLGFVTFAVALLCIFGLARFLDGRAARRKGGV